MGRTAVYAFKRLLSDYTDGSVAVLDPTELADKLASVTNSERFTSIRHVRNSDHFTALHVAATNDHSHVISTLLEPFTEEECYQLISIVAKEGDTAVHRAANNGHTNTLNVLLCLMSNHDCYRLFCQQDYWKFTPLHYSASNGHTKALLLLLKFLPSDPTQKLHVLEKKNENMLTALGEAEKLDNSEIIEKLRRSSADAEEERKANDELRDRRLQHVEEELAKHKAECQAKNAICERKLNNFETAAKRKNEMDIKREDDQEKRICGLERKLDAQEKEGKASQAECQKQLSEMQRKQDGLEQSQDALSFQLAGCNNEVQILKEEIEEQQTQLGAEQPVDSFPESVMEGPFPVQETSLPPA